MTTIKGGVTTSTGSDIVFTNPTAKVVMTISSAGELTIGDHVTPAELGQMLVQEFGRSYGSALRAAEERANRAETTAKGLKSKLAETEGRLSRLTAKTKEEAWEHREGTP